MATITYTRTYTYGIEDAVVDAIRTAPSMYDAILRLKEHAGETRLSLETMSCICKSIRGLPIEEFVYPLSAATE